MDNAYFSIKVILCKCQGLLNKSVQKIPPEHNWFLSLGMVFIVI